MTNKEVADLVNSALSDKNYVIDKLLPALRLARKSLLADDMTLTEFNRVILKLNQAIATAKFMRCRKKQ